MDERTELLPKSAEDTTTTTRHEAKVILGYAVPIAITTTLRYLVSGAAVLAAGRLGTRELAAANLANLTCNVTGLAIVVGIGRQKCIKESRSALNSSVNLHSWSSGHPLQSSLDISVSQAVISVCNAMLHRDVHGHADSAAAQLEW